MKSQVIQAARGWINTDVHSLLTGAMRVPGSLFVTVLVLLRKQVLLSGFICLFLCLTFASLHAASGKYSSVKVDLQDRETVSKLQEMGCEIIGVGPAYVQVVIRSDEIPSITAAGMSYELIIDDLTRYYQSRLDGSRPMGGYRTLSEIGLVLDSISDAYPSIVTQKDSIGATIEGRPIWVVKISDNPQDDEDEPEIYFCAAQHAREVITPEVLIYFMKYLTDNYATDDQVAFLVDHRELFFSPCLNPDGYYYNESEEPGGGGMWRKNRRDNGDGSFGVDLNRNYAYQWAYDDTGSSPVCSLDNYRGTAAFSEPETAAIEDFVLARHFTMIIDYHSCLVRFYYPWAYDRIYTEDNGLYQNMGDSVRIETGYIATLPWVWDSKVNGAYIDWGYSQLYGKPKTYSVAVEVGNYGDGSFWPPTDSIGPLVELHIEPNLFYARIADDPQVLANPVPPSIYSPGGHVTSGSFTLYWHHSDVHNPAVSYQVMQSTSPGEITEDFETSFYPWTARGFSAVDTVSHSGEHSFYSGQGFGLDQTLTAGQAIHVDPGDTLRFWTRYSIVGYDCGYVETSTDSGLTWTTMPGNITGNQGPFPWCLGNDITGENRTWVLAKFDLGGFVGQEILIRFRFLSFGLDQDTTFGWYVDDVSPLDFFEETTMLADAAVDTSLLVEDLVRGNYYYQVRARDAENQLSPLSSPQIVHCSEGISCNWLVGDADGSSSYDIDDVVYLVAYIFSGGPAPTPNEIGSGDANCSDEPVNPVDIDDVVYLVAYIFDGGPSPAPTCDCADY